MIIVKLMQKGRSSCQRRSETVGIEPGTALSIKLVDDHVEIRALRMIPLNF